MSTITLTSITTAIILNATISPFVITCGPYTVSDRSQCRNAVNSLPVKGEYIPQHLAMVSNHLWVLICATTVYKVQG